MDATLRDEWAVALESGDYKQGKTALKTTDNEFCCLGVLCDILSKKDPENIQWEYDVMFGYPRMFSISTEESSAHYIPSKLADKIGITQQMQSILSHMNDMGKKFTTIAEFIRKSC